MLTNEIEIRDSQTSQSQQISGAVGQGSQNARYTKIPEKFQVRTSHLDRNLHAFLSSPASSVTTDLPRHDSADKTISKIDSSVQVQESYVSSREQSQANPVLAQKRRSTWDFIDNDKPIISTKGSCSDFATRTASSEEELSSISELKDDFVSSFNSGTQLH